MNLQLPNAWHFFGLELAVAAAFALTLAHAIENRRRGDLFQWLTAFFYGVLIELVAFNFWDNYDHGQFTVQLYHHKLPLYVTLLYPAFHYTGLKLVESWRLKWFPEALLVGLCIMLIDVPFDIVGPDAGWWRWSTKDPNLAVRWLGVPITSYYWYLLFGAIYAALTRVLKKRTIYLTPLVGAAVLLLGMVAFIPFHLLKAIQIPDEWIVGAHIAACGVLAWWVRPPDPEAIAGRVRASAALLQLFPVLVLLTLWPGTTKAAAVLAAVLALGGIWRRMVADAGARAHASSRRLQRRSL